MFVVVYRWRVKAGSEGAFRAAWARLTDAIREKHGSLGSRLHVAVDGTFVAYAQWPSRARRDEAVERGSPDAEAGAQLKACIEERFPDLELEVDDDRLVKQG